MRMRREKRAAFGDCLRLVWLDGANTRLTRTKGTRAVRSLFLTLGALSSVFLLLNPPFYAWWWSASTSLPAAAGSVLLLLMGVFALCIGLAGVTCRLFRLYRVESAARYLPAAHAHALSPRAAVRAAPGTASTAAFAVCPVCGASLLVLWDARRTALKAAILTLMACAVLCLVKTGRLMANRNGFLAYALTVSGLLVSILLTAGQTFGVERRLACRLGWYTIVRENPEWED